jgi:hypothetical protein
VTNAAKIVDVLLETGEPDQDYDHGPWDAIVRELDYQGVKGVTHREFDKYQGTYLRVPYVGKFWLGEDSFDNGQEFWFRFSPENVDTDGDVPVLSTSGALADEGEWVADVDELAEYCKRILAIKLQRQTARDAVDAVMAQSPGKKPVKGKAKADLGGSMAGAPGMMAMPSDI